VLTYGLMMCHTPHHHRRAVVPDQQRRRDPSMRASDGDREETVSELRHHAAAGRLDVDELEQRIEAAYAARTHGDLQRLSADLPRRRAVQAPRPDRHGHDWRVFAAVSALLVAIWAVSGAGYFWPAWVIVWWAFAIAMKSAPRRLLDHGRSRSTSMS
jgi:hypothetical protein